MILVTGAAGFIGAHLSKRLLLHGYPVIGIDNMNDYYDVELKENRLKWVTDENFTFVKMEREDQEQINALFKQYQPSIVIDLAAQAGVRYSLENPHAYINSNIVGFISILEACRYHNVDHLIYASSSSVYGANTKLPFSVHDNVDHPVSLYAATKKANELMAHTYSHLYGLPTTGLRFFTVYGPWGRPDMALYQFTEAILEGKPIKIYNHGNMERDFTYIDDIVEGIVRIMNHLPKPNSKWSDNPDASSRNAPYNIYNIGSNTPVKLMDFIAAIENKLGVKAKKEYLPLQSGDVLQTYADIDDLIKDVGYKPSTSIEEGIRKFIDWYKDYYGYK